MIAHLKSLPRPLDAALSYAARGWPVLPLHGVREGACTCGRPDCSSPGKHPRSAHGVNDATADKQQIEAWWGDWPDANVGVATGAVSGLVVLDVDPRNGGDDSLDARIAEHGPLPDTVESLTGGGGRHLLFKHPGGTIRTRPDALGRGLDLKADGGYIVAPPSLHASGKRYEWELSSDPADLEVADAPDWLLALPQAKTRGERRDAGGSDGQPIRNGERNDALTSLAGSMRRRAMTEAAIRAALQAENRERCEPPLPDEEVERIAKSVARYAPAADGPAVLQPLPQVLAFQPFPVEVLPEPVRSYVAEGAEAIGCDPSYVALPLLSALAAAIGNTRCVQLKADWTEPSVLWTAIVGPSGTQKSPAIDLALKPIREFQQAAMTKDGNRYLCSDITVEAVAELLEANPRGLLLCRDELAGWVASFDAYKTKGRAGDASHWLEMHRAGQVIVDRKTGEKKTTCVPRAAVSVTGGIQPETLARVLGKEHFENGLAARLLLAMPPTRERQWTDVEVDADTAQALRGLFERLLALKPDEQDKGAMVPVSVPLAPEARDIYVAFFDRHNEEQAGLADSRLVAAWSKLEGYAARLGLVVHHVREAKDSAEPPRAICVPSIEGGIAIADWFKQEVRRVYIRLQETETERNARELVEYIERRGGRVTPRDLMRHGPCCKKAGEARALLDGLARDGWGEWRAGRAGDLKATFCLYGATDTDRGCVSGKVSVSVAQEEGASPATDGNPGAAEKAAENILDKNVSMGYNGVVMGKLSDQIREAIDASEMSRYRICKKIGLSEAQMSRFMNGKAGLSLKTLDALANLLGIEVATKRKRKSRKGR